MLTIEEQTNNLAKKNTQVFKQISIQFYKSNRKNSKLLKDKNIIKDINEVIDLYDVLDTYNKLQKTYSNIAVTIKLYENYNTGLCHSCQINATLCNKKFFSSYEQFINEVRSAVVLKQGLNAWHILAGIHDNKIVRSLINEYYHN